MSEDQAYKDGDIVWVKLGNNWWPGEVIDATRHPDGTVSHIKRKLYCIVKFFNEDAYEYVSNVKQIYPFQSAKKEEFLKKGFSLYNSGNKFMEKFPEDVKIAERLTRQKTPSLFINDRPDSIVKAILGQPIVLGGSSDGYGGSGAESVGGGNSTDYREKRRSCESITKIMNITPNKPKMGLPSPSLLSNSSFLSSSSSNNNAKNISTGDSISNRCNVGNNNANNNNNNYRCNLCGFTSVRQNVMILHRKSHSNRNSGGIGGTMASPHQNKTNIIDTNTKANKISVLKPSLLSTTTTTATSSTSIKMTAASKTLKPNLPVVAAAPRVKSNNDKVVNESFDSTKVLPALRSAATTTTTILISDTSSSELDVSSIDGTLARRSRRHTRTSASKTPPPAVVAANTPATIVTHNVLNGSKTTIKPADFLEQTKPIKKIPKKRDFASLQLQDAIENAVVLEQEIPLAADIIADAATSSPTAPILKDKTSATATKGNAEEIRNMLLADWSDEDETPDLEIGDDKREKSTKKDTKCATDSTVATATTSTPNMRGKTQNTSRIRNIPKKDRRNVILDDFNNDLSVIEPVASSSEINLADSSNSSSTAEVVEIVEQEQPEGETEAIITINDDDDGDEKEAALQEGMDKCKPTNQDKHSPQNVATSRHSELENHEPNDKSLTTSVLSCFDFQDDDEDEDIDAATNVVNTSVAHFKKKYLCNEKSLQPITTKDGGDNNMDSSHDKQQQQHEERAKQDQDLAAEIESLLEQTQPPAAADLIISRKASFEEGIAVKDLPIKERSKRIFKSRNRSRVVESKSSTESRTNSLSTDESLTKDNSSTVAAAIMEDITPKKPLVEDKSTRISSEQDKGYGQQHNGKNSKPCESMVGEANNETTPENLIEAATIQTLTKLAGIEENEPDDFNSEEMDVEKTHLNPGNKTRNNSLICLEDDIVAIIKQEKVNAEEPAQKITTAQETEERSPKVGDEDKVCDNQLSDNTPVTNQEIKEEQERVQGATVIEDVVLKETEIEEKARDADKPIDKVQEVDSKQTILNTVLNENEEEPDKAIEEHLDTQITEIPVTTEESEITTENAAETPGITMAEKKENFTSDADQLLTEDLPQQRQTVNTSPLDENSSLCASDTGAEFGSPASMLSEERLPAYPFSRNETPQPIEGNEIALAESESNDDDAKKQQSEVKDAEIIESKENDCSETKENVLTAKNRRRRLRGGKANSSKRKDLLKKSAERLKNSHQEEVAKDFVDSQEVLSADTNSIQDKPQRQQEEGEESKEDANYCETTSQEDTEKSKDEEEEVNPSLEVNSSEKVNEEVFEDCIGESISCAKDASMDAVEKGVEICDTIENTKEASIETFENRAKISDERECPIMLQESLDQDVPNKKPGNQPSNESNETESETKHINDKIEDSETNDNVLIKVDINNAALEKVDEDNLQIPMEMSKCIKDLKETNDDEEEIVTKELGAQKSKEDENQLDNEANELRNDDMQLDDILSKKENSESSMEYGKEIDTASLNDSAAVTSLESKKVLGTEAEVIQVEDITKKAEDKEEEKGNDMKADESKSADVLLESQRIVEAIDALEANMQKKSETVTNLAENEDFTETPTDEKSHTKTPKKRGGDIIMPIKSKQRKQEEEEVSLEEETLTSDLNKEEIFTECEKGSLKETEEPPESKKMVEDQNMESITTTNENLPTLEDATDSDIKENKEEETSWPIEETEISAIIEKALSSESHKATIDGKDAEASKEERSAPKNDRNSQTVNEKKNDESEATTKPNPSTTEDLSMESLMEKTTTDYLKEFDKLMNQNQEQNVDNENEEIMKNIIIEVQMDNNVCRRIDTLGFTETIGDNESKSATSQKPTVSKTIKRRKTICFDTSVRPSSRKGPVYDFEECPPTTTTFATATTTTTSRALKMKPLKRTAERKMTMPDIDRTTRRCEFARELKTTCKSRRGSSLEDNITSFLLHRPSSGTHDEDDLVQDLFSDDTSSRLSMDAANVSTNESQPRKLSTLHEAKQHNRNSTAADSNAPAKTPNGRNMKRKASQNKTISQRSVADNHPPQNKMARDVTATTTAATQSDHLKISDNQITTAQQQLMQLQQQQPQNQSSSIILNTQTSRTRKPHKTTAAATTAGHNQQPPPQNGNQLVVQQQQMQQQQQQVITQLASPQNIVLQPVLPQQANEGFIITTAGSREDENVIDSNTQLIALPTQPYPGYTETFLLCKVNGNTCKPVDNVPLYLNHQLNELVPIPAEVLEAGPKLIVADTSLNDSKEEEDGNTQEAIMEQNKSHHDVLHRGGHKNDNSPGIHIANVTADEEDGDEEDGGVEGSDVGGTGIQQDFMDDITEANTNATMECTDDTANNGILLNIEGQQVLLDAATFAHLLANPDTNTQLISEDGTEYVLTHEVLQALYMQQQQQQQQQQHHHEQQVLEIANAAAGAGVNNDIIAVAMAGSDLYDNGVLTIDTTQALQLIEDGGGVVDGPVDGVIFQQATPTAAAPLAPPPHLTPPAVVTNAVLDQSPIMSTLEVPTNSRTHCISVPSTMAMVAPSNVVMGEVGGTPTNLDDSLAAIGVTAQSSSISSSLGLPITVTDPNIASKVTSAGPLNEILQFVSHRPATSQATAAALATAALAGESRIFND